MAIKDFDGVGAIAWGQLASDTQFLYQAPAGEAFLNFYLGATPELLAMRTASASLVYVAQAGVAVTVAPLWTVASGPSPLDAYEWRLPNNENQHGEQTVGPGDLLIKPSKLALQPTNSPKRSGVQHGQDDWNYTNVPDSSWYVLGFIET